MGGLLLFASVHPLSLRNRELHSEKGSRGKDEMKASIFEFHFCLIPLISEGITGPIMIERPLARLTLPGPGAA